MPNIKISNENYEMLCVIGGSLQMEGKIKKKSFTFDDVICYLLAVLQRYNEITGKTELPEDREQG